MGSPTKPKLTGLNANRSSLSPDAEGRERRNSLLSAASSRSSRGSLAPQVRERTSSLSVPMGADVLNPMQQSPRSSLGSPKITETPKARERTNSLSVPMGGEVSHFVGDPSPRSVVSSPKSSRRVRLETRRKSDPFLLDSKQSMIWTIFTPNIGLFVLYFVLSANDGIIKAKSKTVKKHGQPDDFPYALASVMFMSCIVSLCIGVLVTVCNEKAWDPRPETPRDRQSGWRYVARKCLDVKSIWRITPINALFQIAFVLKFEALRRLDPDIISMLSQANLVLLAIAARVLMGKKYRSLHFNSLVMITLLMFLYLMLRDGTDAPLTEVVNVLRQTSDHRTGYYLLLFMCIIETMATVLAETWMKRAQPGHNKPLPFWVQKVHVDFSGLCLLVLWIFLPPLLKWDWLCRPLHSEKILEFGLLSGWDRWTVAVLLMVVSKAWLAGLVSKRFDSVVKQIGSCLAILVTYVEVVIWIEPPGISPNVSTFVCLMCVLCAVVNFGLAERSERQKDKTAKNRGDFAGNYKVSSAVCAQQSIKSYAYDGSHSDSGAPQPQRLSIPQHDRTSSEDP